jgi:hypothetical protein
MKIFIKPSGAEVKVNQSSESHAIALGWVEKQERSPEVKEFKQRGRPRKGA